MQTINVHETFTSGVHMYVYTYIHTYIKEKKSHLVAPLVMYHSWFQSWKKTYSLHNIPPFGRVYIRAIIFSGLLFFTYPSHSRQKRQMTPKPAWLFR